ncbi:GNAT family N-acetyltransferase [Rhodoligotrophos defluvii]|uniref:GNAT family N-acetyltransferase n=1 Tax=Rhodoligotrophos defluvii TaxID=2561934 RepID=UPI0010CA10AF|nr:GNAT family N-acetyltransferase [Rhodoligotrophos defluvii]
MSRADPDPDASATAARGRPALVRRFEDEDTPAVIALAEELRRFEAGLYGRMRVSGRLGRWYVEDLLADCADTDGEILVADIDGEVVGYVSVRARVTDEARDRSQLTYAMVDDLIVSRAFRGRGIGRLLIKAAQDHARRKGASFIRIGVLASNRSAHDLYRRAGFADHLIMLEKPLDG